VAASLDLSVNGCADEPAILSDVGNLVVYGWSNETADTRYNLTCVVDARPLPRLSWTHHHHQRHHHHLRQSQQLQQPQPVLQTNETFRVFHLNSTATVLQVHRTG